MNRAIEKTPKVAVRTSLMFDLGRSKEEKRHLLISIAMSVLYETPVWSETVNIQFRKVEMNIKWKAAMRCVGTYRTVSTGVVCVVACTPLIELIVQKFAVIYKAVK